MYTESLIGLQENIHLEPDPFKNNCIIFLKNVLVPLDRPALLEVEVTPQTDWTFLSYISSHLLVLAFLEYQ